MTAKLVGAEALQRRFKAISGPDAARTRMRLLGTEIVSRAKRDAPRKTSNLGRSIAVTEASDDHVTVDAQAAYAAYVEKGTRAHDIRPRRARALRFAATAGGARLTGSPRTGAPVVFAKVVHHPGTKAQPFLEPAARSTVADAGGIVLEDVTRRWNGAA